MDQSFSYAEAFSRNIGWVTREEQQLLRAKRVAIAGMGGVGGVHLLTLARLGVGAFNLADFDSFALANMNRQVGAGLTTLGQPKLDVLVRMAKDINPELDLKLFPAGVSAEQPEAFLSEADLYVDGLDFFAFAPRAATFAACTRLRIPAITAAPLGVGTALLTFMPDGMTFEEYFGWEGQSDNEKALRFLLGLAPAGLHRSHLVDPTTVNLAERRGPSTIMACQICAGVAATEAMKVLLGRGAVRAAPHGMQFDPYAHRLVRTWRPGGYRNPIQRLMLMIGRRQMAKMLQAS